METYTKPAEKIAMILSFFLNGTLSFQMVGIGKLKTTKSETTLKIPEAMMPAAELMQ